MSRCYLITSFGHFQILKQTDVSERETTQERKESSPFPQRGELWLGNSRWRKIFPRWFFGGDIHSLHEYRCSVNPGVCLWWEKMLRTWTKRGWVMLLPALTDLDHPWGDWQTELWPHHVRSSQGAPVWDSAGIEGGTTGEWGFHPWASQPLRPAS